MRRAVECNWRARGEAKQFQTHSHYHQTIFYQLIIIIIIIIVIMILIIVIYMIMIIIRNPYPAAAIIRVGGNSPRKKAKLSMHHFIDQWPSNI